MRNQEQNRLRGEIDRLNKQFMSKIKEFKKEKDEVDELIIKLKDDFRIQKDDNFLLESKVEELFVKLNKYAICSYYQLRRIGYMERYM